MVVGEGRDGRAQCYKAVQIKEIEVIEGSGSILKKEQMGRKMIKVA